MQSNIVLDILSIKLNCGFLYKIVQQLTSEEVFPIGKISLFFVATELSYMITGKEKS
jgi:hypothetical protein